MKEQVLFSFGVPCYNSEDSIEQCLNSILELNLRSFEIVVVDDGSTDKSPEILGEMASRHSQIVFIKSETNGGAYECRKKVVQAAKGTIFVWVDSDDYVTPELKEVLLTNEAKLKDRKTIVVHDSWVENSSGNRNRFYGFAKPRKTEASRLIYSIALGGAFGSYPWSLIVPTGILRKVFEVDIERTLIDDQAIGYRYYLFAENIEIVDATCYVHRLLDGSDSHGASFFERLSNTYVYLAGIPELSSIVVQLRMMAILYKSLHEAKSLGAVRPLTTDEKRIMRGYMTTPYLSRKDKLKLFLLRRFRFLFQYVFAHRRRF